ncbi:MAG: glycosyltransferase family 4 protein [Candidatus Woesearchaeota archaeon]|jgi:glycosyltransferase involved in cell wall biosynthesis
MKILIICPDWFPNISGFGISCYEFVKKAEKNHEITILTPYQKNIDKKGLNVVTVPKIFNLMGRNPFVLGLLKKIKKTDYDVILLYSYMFEMNSRVAIWRKLGIIKKPVILMYRGSLEDEVLNQLSSTMKIAKKTYDKTLGRAVFKYSDFIISNSKPTLNVIKEKYNINTKKMTYIPSAIHLNEYKKSELNNKRILFNGRLIQNKGIKFFEQIILEIPKTWKFTIIGDGPMEDQVKKLQQKYANIEYLGKISKPEVNKILSKTDILILPTFAEGSPRAVLEACASGVPSIVFDVGDVKTILDKNKNGFIIPSYNINIFIEKMKELIDDATLRKKMGNSARIYAQKNLDWTKTSNKMLNTIQRVVDEEEKN